MADDPLALANALQALTETLVHSLEDDAGDPASILEQRATLLAAPFEGEPVDGDGRAQLEAVRAAVEALERAARDLLSQRIARTKAALIALEAGWTATRTYLEERALPPLLLDRRE